MKRVEHMSMATASSSSSTFLHYLKNISLVLVCAFFTPLCTFITLLSSMVSPFTKISKHIKHQRQWRQKSSSTFRPRTVLVTGVGTTKGLALARAFYRAGHRVIGADFEPYFFPVCGHFSKSIETFYRLTKPTRKSGTAEYVLDIFSVVKKEKVELWVSCSDAPALDDVDVMEVLEKRTKCKSIQLDHSLTETLSQIPLFIQSAKQAGLNVPESHIVTSETEALNAIYPQDRSPRNNKTSSKDFTITPIRPNARSKPISIVPSAKDAEAQIKALNPTPFSPFFIQEQAPGTEYKTHVLILSGKITAFVAYPSTSNIYTALPHSSAISQAMLLYTRIYISSSGPITGHLSLKFRVPDSAALMGESLFGATDDKVRELTGTICAVSASPTVSPAIVLLSDESEDLAEAYLSVLPGHEPLGIASGHRDPYHIITPKPRVRSYYWVGEDIVSGIFGSLFAFLGWRIGIAKMWKNWMDVAADLVYCRDATWEVWDPWSFWWLYVGYWPAVFMGCLWEGRRWRECDFAEGKALDATSDVN